MSNQYAEDAYYAYSAAHPNTAYCHYDDLGFNDRLIWQAVAAAVLHRHEKLTRGTVCGQPSPRKPQIVGLVIDSSRTYTAAEVMDALRDVLRKADIRLEMLSDSWLR